MLGEAENGQVSKVDSSEYLEIDVGPVDATVGAVKVQAAGVADAAERDRGVVQTCLKWDTTDVVVPEVQKESFWYDTRDAVRGQLVASGTVANRAARLRTIQT